MKLTLVSRLGKSGCFPICRVFGLMQNQILTAKEPKQPGLRGSLGACSLGGYSLVVYSLVQPMLDLAVHSPDWEPTTVWESTVSSNRFWILRCTHLRNRKIIEDPSTQALFREKSKKRHWDTWIAHVKDDLKNDVFQCFPICFSEKKEINVHTGGTYFKQR